MSNDYDPQSQPKTIDILFFSYISLLNVLVSIFLQIKPDPHASEIMDIYEAKMAALVVSRKLSLMPFTLAQNTFEKRFVFHSIDIWGLTIFFSISDEGKSSSRFVGSKSSCPGPSWSSYFAVQVSESSIGSRGMTMIFSEVIRCLR